MRCLCSSAVLALPLLLSLTAACPGPAPFVPEDPDAGFVDEGVTAADIGVPCVYDPANPSNPTNQCPAGTECVIVTRDFDGRGRGFNPLGMSLIFWEDQLTVATSIDGVDVDIGYCSVVGNAVVPPLCPVGTVQKFVSSFTAPQGFAALCLKPCASSAECGGDRVCDTRFVDPGLDTLNFCVSPCRSDLSHCVRSAIISVGENNAAVTGLLDSDLFGDSACNEQTGICNAATKGTGNDGAPCESAADCAPGHACYQAQLFFDAPQFGFCGQRCTQFVGDQQTLQGTCEPGEVCQPGMNFSNPNMIAFDFAGNVAALEGICLDICVEGVTECVNGSQCGATDASVVGQAWVGTEVCAPDAIREAG